ncbi:MAG: hypothetical protein ACP5XB_13735 [Isosphaeraceae bacterium]
MNEGPRRKKALPGKLPLALTALALLASGCQLVPRSQLDECHRLSQTLRSENARLKDQMLALRSDNQDYSERAVDDARRIAQLETVNQRLETSVQAYQDDRTRLESAYKELLATLPGSLKPASMDASAKNEPKSRRLAEKTAAAVRQIDPQVRKASGDSPRVKVRAKREKTTKQSHGVWAPVQRDHGGSQHESQDLDINLNHNDAGSARPASALGGS